MLITPEVQKRLIQAMADLEITNYRLAKILRYSPSTIANYCQGKVENPDQGKIAAICNVLGITEHWLETGEDRVESPNNITTIPVDENWLKDKLDLLLLKIDADDQQYQDLHTDLNIVRRGLTEMQAKISELFPYVKQLTSKFNEMQGELKNIKEKLGE